jgi:ubiquinone/menaquinone biosynthesis C-methylase UbiE
MSDPLVCSNLERQYQLNKQKYMNSDDWKQKDRLLEENLKILSQESKLGCDERKKHNKETWYQCVHDVTKKGSAVNPYAVCTVSVGQ